MDCFSSETVSSDSTSQEDPAPQNQKKVHTRKTRRTEDLISLNTSEPLQRDAKETDKRKRQNISFLPKIDLSEDVGQHAATKINKVKQNRSSLAKKISIFKIGRSMIEGKQFQSHRSTSKSKFPKIKLKPTNTGKHKMGQATSKKERESEELEQVLSDAAEEFLSEPAIKVKDGAKRKSKSFSRKSGQGSKNAVPMVYKDLYVNLISLEKTDLLNADQLMQLKAKKNITSPLPLRDVNFNKRNSESSRTKMQVGKENRCNVETPKHVNLHSTIQLTDKINKSPYSKSVLCLEYVAPCKVILKKLTLEQIRLLTFSKESKRSLVAALLKANNVSCKAIETSQGNMNADELTNQNTFIDAVAPLGMSLYDSNLPFFNPGGSSSPLVPLQKSVIKLNECSNTSSTNKRLTYELEENETKLVHSKNLTCDAELTNKNATYEVGAGSLTRRSSNIRKGFEELAQLSPETNIEPSTSTNKFGRKSRRSSTKNETYELNESNNVASKQKRTESFKNQPDRCSANISKTRRSTLTLEDSINDVALLKSACDTSGIPQMLNKSGKSKSETSIKTLENKASLSHLDFSNVTIRKRGSSYSGSKTESLQKIKSCYESMDLESSFEADETDDDINILPSTFEETSSTFEETSKPSRSDTKESSEEEEDTETPSTSSITARSLKSSTLSKQIGKNAILKSIIEISDDEEKKEESYSPTSSESSDVESEKHSPKPKPKVTFETDSMKIKKRKSTIRNAGNGAAVTKNRRVTFSDTSVIIIDDSSQSEGSPVPWYNKRGTVNRTPLHRRVESLKYNKQSPRVSSRGAIPKIPTQQQSYVDSPQFNKRGVVGRTPVRLKMPVDNTVSCASPKLNERLGLQNDSFGSSIIAGNNSNTAARRIKMPDFASIHKKMFDKMLNLEEHSKRKDERAKMLLSGRKRVSVDLSFKKSAAKQPENNSHKKITSKKQLKYGEPSATANKRELRKKALVVSSTPKSTKNEKNGYTRFGFKLEENNCITKKEQLLAIANKTRPAAPKSNTVQNRTEIRGVRSNRRFDLLMKMRRNQNK